jgi:hypothetical protein
MAMNLIATAVMVAMLGPLWSDKDIDPPSVVAFQGDPFSLLSGSTLESTLVGYSLQAVTCGNSSQCIEAFYERGRYAQSEDRGVIRGTYTLRQDRYCAGWDEYQFCAAVYQANDGRLATTNLKCGVPCLTLVERREAPRNGSDWAPLG